MKVNILVFKYRYFLFLVKMGRICLQLFNCTMIHKKPERFPNSIVFRDINKNHEKVFKCYSRTVPDNNHQTLNIHPNEGDFSGKLVKWAIKHNITNIAFSKLLKLLSEFGISDLPINARALLKAKEEEITIVNMPPGVYTHFGLRKNLKNLITNFNSKNLFNKTDIDVSIFVDNLPLTKFSSRGMWVILGSVEGFTSNIFFVGAYLGFSKPKSSNLFLSEFVNEAKVLCTEGLEINSDVYNVTISRLICDAPAKAFVLNIKDFNAYSSCTKCNTMGQFKGKKMCFLEKSNPRHDDDFKKKEIYVGDRTNMLEIPRFGIVSNVTLDYMHLVCLGVVNKLLSIWLAHEKYWICEKSASKRIKSLASIYPCEFNKKPKTLNAYSLWSGIELRQFLLYYCPIVLKNTLKKEYYDHFLLLHAACRLLCIKATPETIDCGKKLLNSFVKNYVNLYKGQQITHNFHGLYHLADECTSHGTLDKFSAFPFEKFLIQLRNSMRKSKKKSIPQTIIREAYETVFTKSLAKLTEQKYRVGKKLQPSNDSDQFKNFTLHEKLLFKNFEINPTRQGDKYVLLKNSRIISVTNILEKKEKSNKTHFVAGKEFSSVSNFHSEPFDSLPLNMFKVRDVSGMTDIWPVDMIDRKCMIVPHGDKEAVMIGLLDENY